MVADRHTTSSSSDSGPKRLWSPVRRTATGANKHRAPADLKKIKIAILGDSLTGKSALCSYFAERNGSNLQKHYFNINSAMGAAFKARTIGVDLCAFQVDKDQVRNARNGGGRTSTGGGAEGPSRFLQVNIWDLGGGHDFGEIRTEFYKEAQLIVLVCDATDRRSQLNLEKWRQEVLASGADSGSYSVCVVANKCEELQGPIATASAVTDAKQFAAQHRMPIFEVSAVKGTNMSMLLEYFIQQCG
ncbi:unnamed protein product [Amoebophrya sp. A120]|nr:unnamed protein product [Amoebophrya sp. A120]|eukprot:GSA120T00006409001.1